MGKGDKRTRRGKIWAKSYGKTRPHKDTKPKAKGTARPATPAAKPRPKAAGATTPGRPAPKPRPAAPPPLVPGPLPGPASAEPSREKPAAESGS